MSINIPQLERYIIQPTLTRIGLDSPAARTLLVMTMIAESGGKYIHQLGNGPAVGPYQMEPATHDDCWAHYLEFNPALAQKVRSLEISGLHGTGVGSAEEMAGNWYYATAMARIKYLRDSKPLPDAADIEGLAKYHKRVYNTYLGAAEWEETARLYRQMVS